MCFFLMQGILLQMDFFAMNARAHVIFMCVHGDGFLCFLTCVLLFVQLTLQTCVLGLSLIRAYIHVYARMFVLSVDTVYTCVVSQ